MTHDFKTSEETINNFSKLLRTVRTLRSPSGCPWDKKQTTTSLEKYFREEFEEILAAIANDDRQNLCEELGDFLYLIIMMAEINRNEETFTLDDILISINEKLIRRHPHVFGDSTVSDEKQLREQWERIKRQEKTN